MTKQLGEKTWFEVKVRYFKVLENGKEQVVSENYFVDALSFTEVEARAITEMQMIASGNFEISNIKKSNITEVVASGDETDDRWYKCKVVIIDVDDLSGKEKKSNTYALVAAKNTDTAL